MILPYIKYAWLFLIVLLISSVLAYSGFNEISSYAVQILYSTSISLLLHFLVFQLCQMCIKNKTVVNVLMLMSSLIILGLNVGFYVGVKNWGSPVNLNLVIAGISDISGVMTLAFQKIGLSIVFVIVLLVLYYSYYRNSNRLFPVQKEKYNLLKRNVYLLGTLLMILGFVFSYPKVGMTEKEVLKQEVYSSFFGKSDDIQRIHKLDLGIENRIKSYPVINNFDKKNVILFSIDCLREDHLTFNGYSRNTSPFLDSLYNDGKLKKYKLSTSTCSSSFCGIMSMLNSKNLRGLSYFKYGIHDYLKKQGYRTNFILSGVHEGWYNLRKHYGSSIDYYIEGKDKSEFNTHDDALIVDEVMNIPAYSDEPNFFFFHFMGPHMLGHKDDEYEIFKPIIERGLVNRLRIGGYNDDNLKALYTNNYDNGIYQSDQYIKAILDILREKGYLENAIVAIAGDHGESLGENSTYLGHGNALTDEYINVPILFLNDDMSSYKEDIYASHIDIAPTIISRLGLPVPDIWQGKDLTKRQKSRMTFHEQTPHGFEEPHIGVISIENNLINKYLVDQNSGDELIIINNLSRNSADTLYFGETLHNYFREKVEAYAGVEYNEFKNSEDVVSTNLPVAGYVEERKDERTIEVRQQCKLYTKELFSELIGDNNELFRTVTANARRNKCTCDFFWNSENDEAQRATITASTDMRLKLTTKLLVKNKNYRKFKNKKFSNIYFNRGARSIIWTSGDTGLIEMRLEEGKSISFPTLMAFVKKNFSKAALKDK